MLSTVKKLMQETILENSKNQVNEKYIMKIKELEEQLLEIEKSKQKTEKEIEELNQKSTKERKKILYKLFGIKSSRIKGLDTLLIHNTNRLLNYDIKMEELKKEIRNNYSIIEDNNRKIEADYSKKQTLKSLGLSFKDACDLLSERKIPIILDESDLEYEERNTIDVEEKKHEEEESGIGLMKDYVLVHKTDFYPKNGRIRSIKEINKRIVNQFKLDKLGIADVQFKRNTIHFSVNSEVGSHMYGNWENVKYAVLIPFKDMPVSQLRCGLTVDTYIEGGLNLPESSIILCPEEELDMVQLANPSHSVIGYKGKSVTNYANAMIGHLGYKIESCTMRHWVNSQDEEEYNSKLSKSGLNVTNEEHDFSTEAAREKCFLKLDSFILMIKKIITENIVLDDNDIKIIMYDPLICFGVDERIMNEIFDTLDKELSQYGIIVPTFNSGSLKNENYGEYLRYNILNQAIQIMENNINQEKSKGR